MKSAATATQFRRDSARGSGLIAVMIALGLMAVMVAVLAKQNANTFMLQEHVARESSLMSLRAYIQTNLSCKETLTNSPNANNCTPGEAIDVWSRPRDGAPVKIVGGVAKADTIDANPHNDAGDKAMGRFEMRARCETCTTCTGGTKLLIEARSKDKKVFDKSESEWKDLFRDIPPGCDLTETGTL